MMTFSSYLLVTILGSVVLLGYVQCESSLSPFGKKVKSKIPKDTYDKLFGAKPKNDGDVRKAILRSVKDIEKMFGIQIDKSTEQQIVKGAKQLGSSNITPKVLFTINVNAVSETLKDVGKLNSSNIDDLVQKYINYLNKVAKSLDNENIANVYPKLTDVTIKYLLSVGLTPEEIEKQFVTNFAKEIMNFL